MRRILAIVLFAIATQTWGARFDCSLEPPGERDQDKLLWSYTTFLTPQEEARINARLVEFARETSNRILVILVDTLCDRDAADLAFEIGERWGIGLKGFDNGVVFLIKPTGPSNQRKVFIATGYGLEGAIPDATCKRIIEEEVIPRFKAGDHAEGIEAALTAMMGLAKGEIDQKSYGRKSFPWPILLFVVFFGIVMFYSWRGRVRRYASTNKLDFWTAMFLLSQMSNKQRGRWHGGGGGFGGGGGGGGFGGFGGGSFGGGGAGGSW